MRRPYRPSNEITQTYNDGIVKIYAETDTADPGYKPVITRKLKIMLPYAERTVGVQRYYSAQQNMIQADMLIRVQSSGVEIDNTDTATIGTRNYTIRQVQTVEGIYPPSIDLTLERITP